MLHADANQFDIDGTLLVTRDLLHWNAFHQAMLEIYGEDTNIEGIRYRGKTDVAILRAALARCGITDCMFNARPPQGISIPGKSRNASERGRAKIAQSARFNRKHPELRKKSK